MPMPQSSTGRLPLSDKLSKSLDAWKADNIRPKIFIRDDDAEHDQPSLQSLVSLSRRFSIPMLMAAVPEYCDRSLAQAVDSSELITVAVHGYSHRNYALPGRERCELCSDRPLDVIMEELKAGRDKLLDIFDGRISNLLVPPWNNIDDGVAEAALDLGFKGISVHGWERMTDPMPRVNTHVDLVNWAAGCVGLGQREIQDSIADQLDVARRLGFKFIGIVSHHRYFSNDDWENFSSIILTLNEHGVDWVEADHLLPLNEKERPGN
jgi:peptidoglycan/xylan/chitin deacetylase (PgdA/CDA1 family)